MKLRNHFLTLLATTTLFAQNNTMAAEAFVYCSDDNKEWEWLNNKNEIVSGTWHQYKVNIVNTYRIFILEGGEITYNQLAEKCTREFGTLYPYPQPADSLISAHPEIPYFKHLFI